MTIVPKTTPVPNPLPPPEAATTSTPASSSLPEPSLLPQPDAEVSAAPVGHDNQAVPEEEDKKKEGNGDGGHDDAFPQPKLRLEIRDLDHPGAAKFLTAVNAGTVLASAVAHVQRLLYQSPGNPHTTCPPTRSVTLILRDMGGVAYTTGVNDWL